MGNLNSGSFRIIKTVHSCDSHHGYDASEYNAQQQDGYKQTGENGGGEKTNTIISIWESIVLYPKRLNLKEGNTISLTWKVTISEALHAIATHQDNPDIVCIYLAKQPVKLQILWMKAAMEWFARRRHEPLKKKTNVSAVLWAFLWSYQAIKSRSGNSRVKK